MGCGRLGFDQVPPSEGGVIAAPPDVMIVVPPDGEIMPPPPPVPSAVCKVTQLPVAVTPALADLAITDTDEGYAVVWLDTQRQVPSLAFRLSRGHELLGGAALPALDDEALGGLSDVGDVLMIAASTGDAQHVLSVSQKSLDVITNTHERPTLTGRDPFISDAARTTNVLVSGDGGDTHLDPIGPDGQLGTRVTDRVRRAKHELACARGPDHAHCVWSQDNDPISEPIHCIVADIDLPPEELHVGSSGPEPTDPLAPILTDCRRPRVETGPGVNGAEMVVWETSHGSVEAVYAVSTPLHHQLAAAGSAPKVRFDGSQFWIAWLDATGTLQLTSFDPSGVIVTSPMPGWRPSGGEAFELNQRDGVTVLAVVRPGELDVLTLCPPPVI